MRPSLYTSVCYHVFYEKGRVEVSQVCVLLADKSGIRHGIPIGSRQKILCADIHTTRRFRDTFHRIRHFTDDKAIPPTRRLFQRDLFRVSNERTVLADFHFTKFRYFQSVIPSACFTNRILTDAFTRLKFVFTQRPRQRANRTLIARVTFFSTPALQRR